MQTNMREAVARFPQPAIEDLDVRRRSLALMRDLCAAAEVKAGIDALGERERRNAWLRMDGRRGIEICVGEVALLLSAGVSRAEVMLLPVLLMEIIEELCSDGALGGDRLALELAHLRETADAQARHVTALVEAEAPEAMADRAQALRREAAAALTLARDLEGRVRRRTLALLRRVG